jgi:16S rRNA G966 N2-methylase RsmD
MEDYYQKYIKYKNKYLTLLLQKEDLQKGDLQKGGGIPKNKFKFIFPYKKGVNYDKLQMTKEGEYSITKRNDGIQLLNIMKDEIGNLENKTITDLTANVGGDTILFGLNFKKVKSIEINKENFKVLENNINVYNLNNVELFEGNSTKIYNWLTDILYIDPPWGGVNYRNSNNIDLFLGDYRLDNYLDFILKQEWRPKYIVLKLPKNYNFDRLNNFNGKHDILNYKKYDILNKSKELRFNIFIIN